MLLDREGSFWHPSKSMALRDKSADILASNCVSPSHLLTMSVSRAVNAESSSGREAIRGQSLRSNVLRELRPEMPLGSDTRLSQERISRVSREISAERPSWRSVSDLHMLTLSDFRDVHARQGGSEANRIQLSTTRCSRDIILEMLPGSEASRWQEMISSDLRWGSVKNSSGSCSMSNHSSRESLSRDGSASWPTKSGT